MAASRDSQSYTHSRNRGMSSGGKSQSSHRSAGSRSGLAETPEEKARRVITTKADPSVAINEAQPGTRILLDSF
jgi:hypothetical protein